MLFSMTGFGEASFENSRIQVGFRIRGVNHRGLDINLRLPPELAYLETALRKCVQDKLFRGRVDIHTEFRFLDDEVMPPARLDEGRLKQLLKIAERLLSTPQVCGPIDVNTLIRMPELMIVDRTGFKLPAKDEIHLFTTMELALEGFLTSRRNEGKHLEADLNQRMQTVCAVSEQVAPIIDARRDQLMDQMRKRLDLIRGDLQLDETRLYQEVVYWSDRLDVSEEVTRLLAHLSSITLELEQPSRPAGKRLEFICQEILREITTLGNKAKLDEISALVVTLKTEMEKIREQLANIE